jgi:hypothetical protein
MELKSYYTRENEKKVSVKYDFGLSLIKKVKLIATVEEWNNIYKKLDDFDFSFDSIEPYLSRPKKNLKTALKKYAEECPEGFSADMVTCVESVFLFQQIVKPRKPSKYGLDWQEKNELSARAAYLYAFLTYASKVSEDDWPDYFNRFCKTYKLSPIDFKNNQDRQEAVRKVMSKYIGDDFDYFAESFFQTFVTESPIKLARIKKLKAIHRSPIDNPFLKPLFKDLP